ncbi:putative pheromone-regulated multispanning membrane protein Prm1 [Talaromyces proteolyticus]|uniref:Plasma membrane fusion protein PRM1 n=1 Tax=Talaromyces proteolyticus TaxID=1131652 RepID=A0AAD4Q0U9_9EURO|nr:putative pheromone-regulated multispanning membrane protein Prm1 [Talaromyces proteolyticus]KAH8697666.1 putative pheromone-regulated multispanning membrane protein Prm1 [Talaromyces proteolyticus]
MRILGRTIFPMLPPYNDQEAPPYTDPDKATPYLGIKARLSQVWINRWTILIMLVLVRVLMAITSLEGDMGDAKTKALSACNSVQSMGSTMASLPHYMSKGVNELTSDGITKAVNGLVEVLGLMISGVEGLVLFYINFLVQTYLCLFTLVARGAAEMALTVASDVTSWLNKTLPSIENDISSAMQTAETGLSKLNDSINSIKKDCNNFITKGLCDDIPSIPTISLENEINEIKSLTLPSSITDDINKVKNEIPTFDDVKNKTTEAIQWPFEQLKGLVKDNLGNYTFNNSEFPVPEKQSLDFCGKNDGIDDFFTGLADTLALARKVAIGVLTVIAALVCVPMAFIELWRWRTTKKRAEMVRTVHDSLDVVYLISRPHTSSLGLKAARLFSNSRSQILVRWVFAYALSVPALVMLSLGLAGLFSSLCQYILLKSVEKEVPELTAQVSQFADKVVSALTNASEEWALGTNQVINSTNTKINHNVFGWVNTSTTALNKTLNTFLDLSNQAINDTFGKTPLYDAVKGIFDCVVEMKVLNVEKGLTWASDHAYVTLPRVPNDTFSTGAAASINSGDSFLSDPGSTTSNEITEVVSKVIDKLKDAINTEAKIAGVLVLLWVLILLMGILRALSLSCMRRRVRGEGGGQPAVPGALDRVEPPIAMSGGAASAPNGFEYEHNQTPHGGTYASQDTNRSAPLGQEDPFQQAEYEYQDQKIGFAGERDYSSAVHPTNSSDMHTRKSSYVEFGGDEKHA